MPTLPKPSSYEVEISFCLSYKVYPLMNYVINLNFNKRIMMYSKNKSNNRGILRIANSVQDYNVCPHFY